MVGGLSSIYNNQAGMDTYTEANHKPIHTVALKADVFLILNYFCLVKICTISD